MVPKLKLKHLLLLLTLTSAALAAGQGWFIIFQKYWSYYSPHMLEVVRYTVYCSSHKPEPSSSFMVIFEVVNRGSDAVKLRSLYVLAKSPSGEVFKIGEQAYVKLTIEPGEKETYRSPPFNLSEAGIWILSPAYSTGSWSGSPANWPKAEILVGELPAPDIHLAEASLGELRAGEEAVVRVKVENTGEKPAKPTIELRVDGEPTSSTTLDLRPSEATIAELKWTPREPGDYTLEVIADPEQEIREHSEEDNKLVIEAHVGAPDLTVEAIDLPPQATPGELEGKAIVANRGDAPSPKAELKVYAESYIASLEVPEIPPGGLAEVAFKLEARRKGELIVTVAVNPTAEFVEWSHLNNIRQARLTIVEERKPDLSVEPTSMKLAIQVGLPAEIQVRVSNLGQATSMETKLVAELAEEEIAEAAVPPIDPESSRLIALYWTPPEPGEYTITLRVDPENKIRDADRGNNMATMTIVVEQPRTQPPSSPPPPSTPAQTAKPPTSAAPEAKPPQASPSPQPTAMFKRALAALAIIAAAIIAVIVALAKPRRPPPPRAPPSPPAKP